MLFTDAVYRKLRFMALIVLPALAALYFGVSQIWGLPNTEEVMGTIALVDTFLGSLLKWSTSTYESGTLEQPKKYDGAVSLEPGEEGGSQLRLHEINPRAVETKTEITLKVLSPS